MTMIKPSLLLDFANSRQLHPGITHARSSTGTFINRLGLVETAAANAPRFDHDPVTRLCRGMLIEESRQFLALHNRDLTNAVWVKNNATATKDQTGADGTANGATRLTATAADASVLQSITSASAQRASAAYVRRITGTGTVSMTIDGGASWTPITVSTLWLRLEGPIATVTNPQIGFRLSNSGDEIAVDFVGLESGAKPTSPVEVAASPVTRAADIPNMTGAGFTAWFRADEGTLVVAGDCTYNASVSAFPRLAAITNNTSQNESIQVYVNTASGQAASVIYDGAVYQGGTSVAYISGERFSCAVAYRANDCAFSFNGGAAVADASASLPTVDRLALGCSGSGATQLNGHLAQIAYYPVRMTNAELAQLSA